MKGHRKSCKYDEEQDRQNTPRTSFVEIAETEAAGFAQLLEDDQGDKITADDEENINADIAILEPVRAAHDSESSMKKQDKDNCNRT